MKIDAVFEKRKWVGLTTLCNNRCIFCLDGNIKDKYYKKKEDVLKEFHDGIKNKCTRLVLSGGEATLHPDFIEFVKKGKELGYRKVQVITNGRMFSYNNFLKQAISAGLGEITFSIHGHNSELHDYLTGTKGSFEQTSKAIDNALKNKIILSCDIVVNKKNISYFPEIMKFLLNKGVMEFDILNIVPFGDAWINKKRLLIDFAQEKNINYIKKGLDLGKKYNAVIWTNRLPPEYLEGYEEYIQDPYKLLDEVIGTKKIFEEAINNNKKIECYKKRCDFCCMKDMCEFIFKSVDAIKTKKAVEKNYYDKYHEIIISKNNYKKINKLFSKKDDRKDTKGIILSLAPPSVDYKNYENIVPRINEITPYIYKYLKTRKGRIKNIPPCFIEKKYRKLIIKDKFEIQPNFIKKDKIDLSNCALYFIEHKKIKGLKCKNCKYYKNCDGIFQKYIMAYSFKELKPVR